MLARVAAANIMTGYISRNDDSGDTFKCYFEANVHAPRVFEVFRDLATSLLPDIAAPIIGLKDEDPIFGPYTKRDDALKVFEPYIDNLQNDGFLEFGLIFAFQGKTEEIYVKSSKYFQIWTNQPEVAALVLERNNIPSAHTLEFIDEYPIVSISLGAGGNAGWPVVMDAIKDSFEILHEIEPPSA